MIRYAILGSVELRDGEHPVVVGGPRQVALLALLLVNANRALSSDRLIDVLWGEQAVGAALKRLQMAIARLRRALDRDGPQGESVLRTVAGGYLLAVRPGELDADVFKARVEHGRRASEAGDAARARTELRAALDMWSGPALADVAYEHFAQPEIRRLEELRIAALEARVDCELQLGEHERLISELQSLVAAHPGRERLAAQLMLALYRCQRQGDALETYARARTYLTTELGLEPGPTLQALQAQILTQSPNLQPITDRPGNRSTVAYPHVTPVPSSAGLLERERQIAEIEDVLGAAVAGRGTTVYVVGEAGAGKTALLGEVASLGRQFGVLRARGDELEHDYPYGIVRQLFDGALRAVSDSDAAFAGPAELARAVFDLGELDGSVVQDAVFSHQHGLYWLTVQLTDQLGPLLLIVDDAHHADESSLRFLRFLSHRLDGLRVVQVLATRPPEQLDAGTLVVEMLDGPECHIVTVDRLSPAGTATYLGRAWSPAAGSLATVCHELSSGNPLMLRALVTEAQRMRVAPDALGGAELRKLGVRSIGQRVQRVLATAPPATLALAQAVAILGADVPPSSAIEVARVAREAAAPALDVLLRLGLLEEAPMGLRFAHPLVRASVHMLMSPVERQDAHMRAARTLQEGGAHAEEVAAHLVAAGPSREPWMAAVLERAAEHALALGVPETAARFLARAVQDAGEDPRLLALLANAESHAGLAGGLDHYRRAIAAATRDRAAELEPQYAGALAMAGQTAKAFDVLLAVATPGDPPAARAALHAAALFTDSPAAFAHRDVVAAGIAAEAPALAAADDVGSRLLGATYAFERALRGDPACAVGALIEPAVRGGGLPLDMRATSPWGYGIWALILCERWSEALRECDRGVEQGRRSGHLVLLALALCLRAGVHLRRGSLLLAEADCVESLQLARYPSWRFGAAACTQFLVEILLEQGRTADARAAFAGLSPAQREPDTISLELLVRACHARLLLAERAAERALAEALDLGRCADEGRFGCAVHIPWRTIGASSAAASGDIAQARTLAADQVQRCRAFGVRGATADALLVQATLAPDDERQRRLDETLEVALSAGAPLSLAKVLVAAAREMRVAGRMRQARELAHEAREVASECAAMPVADAALDELAASGARPRRPAGAGPHLLTASESRVARLAADGASNREIAQALFATQKTVETHLSTAYRKLSISSRAELTSRLSSV